MKEPRWLNRALILAIHGELIARFGGSEGIRDEGLLDSALGRPVMRFQYDQPDLFDLAASYADGIVNNHPFLDGNKRSGFVAAFTFLGINGQRLVAPEEQAVLQTLGLAAGEVGEADYAQWLRESCSPQGK